MKTQVEYLEKWYSQVAGVSAVPLPCRETGKENPGAGVSVQEFKLSFFQREVLTLVHQTVSQALCW